MKNCNLKVGIIGGGWYGCHLALALKKAGHDVAIYERNPTIFSQISGTFGIRLHAGPHYPRSLETRKGCHRGYELFQQTYPELVIYKKQAIYGLGEKDADGHPPRVDAETFQKVCEEFGDAHIIDPASHGYQGLISAVNIKEPSIVLGNRLRSTFQRYLQAANISVFCNCEVQTLQPSGSKIHIVQKNKIDEVDKVINATSYQNLLPDLTHFPFDLQIKYQPCLALMHTDKTPSRGRFSLTIMDGWFPSILPYVTEFDETEHRYAVTHSKWTILGSYDDPKTARNALFSLEDRFVEEKIRPKVLQEMLRFWPEFSERFEYLGWRGEIQAKLRTKKEFRSAITFSEGNIIHIIPSKISNVFDVEREVFSFFQNSDVLEYNGFSYVKGGVLYDSINEIVEKPNQHEPNTCNLQTLQELQERNV